MLQPEGGEGRLRRGERERETLKMDFVQLLVDMYGRYTAA
jgi:hypothetical protein